MQLTEKISRRNFIHRSFGLGFGAFIFKNFSIQKSRKSTPLPMITSSHTNETGKKALETGWKILSEGGSALDAVEKAANVIELDGEGDSVIARLEVKISDKSKLIGKEGSNIDIIRKLAKRHHSIKDVQIK